MELIRLRDLSSLGLDSTDQIGVVLSITVVVLLSTTALFSQPRIVFCFVSIVILFNYSPSIDFYNYLFRAGILNFTNYALYCGSFSNVHSYRTRVDQTYVQKSTLYGT